MSILPLLAFLLKPTNLSGLVTPCQLEPDWNLIGIFLLYPAEKGTGIVIRSSTQSVCATTQALVHWIRFWSATLRRGAQNSSTATRPRFADMTHMAQYWRAP